MSHTAQQAPPLRIAALAVIGLHAGLVLVLWTRLNQTALPPSDPGPSVFNIPERVDPRPAPRIQGHAEIEDITLEPEPPGIAYDPPQSDPSAPTATITERPAGNSPQPEEVIWSRPEIVERTAIPYPTVGGSRPEGVVHLKVRIGIDGSPREVLLDTSSGYPQLDRVALRAVAHWRFKPRQRNGAPVETWAHLPIAFRLQD